MVKLTSLPVKYVGELLELDYSKGFNDDVENKRCGKGDEDSYRWIKIQYEQRYEESQENGRGVYRRPSNSTCFKGWAIKFWVGEGCEPTNIGLVSADGINWSGGAFTKTQYATQFVKSHLTVVAILDICKRLGILEEVSDEGDYWDTRDLSKLADNINGYDKLVSGLALSLKKVFGEENSKCATDSCRQNVVVKGRGESRI